MQRALSAEEKRIFLKKYIRNPAHVGSIAPSSKYLSQEIARLVEGLEKTKVIELGPGTGALTAHLRANEPTIVEIDRDMCELLQKKFPTLEVVNSCALDFLRGVDYSCGIIFSIPMINNPLKEQLASEVQRLHHENLLKWCVMYTYGLGNPFKGIGFSSAVRHKTILRNIPPAHIWHYN